jgi:BASS family bile acid:Na+ symporter
VAKIGGFEEPQRRAISIEVGMQNSSLGVVLATAHFASPLTAVPAAVSAMLMNIMGSGLAVLWRNISFDNKSTSPIEAHDQATVENSSSDD